MHGVSDTAPNKNLADVQNEQDIRELLCPCVSVNVDRVLYLITRVHTCTRQTTERVDNIVGLNVMLMYKCLLFHIKRSIYRG